MKFYFLLLLSGLIVSCAEPKNASDSSRSSAESSKNSGAKTAPKPKEADVVSPAEVAPKKAAEDTTEPISESLTNVTSELKQGLRSWRYTKSLILENTASAQTRSLEPATTDSIQIWTWNLDESKLEIKFQDPEDESKSCIGSEELPLSLNASRHIEVDTRVVERKIRLECSKSLGTEIYSAFFEFPALKLVYEFVVLNDAEARLNVKSSREELAKVNLKGFSLVFDRYSPEISTP